MLPKQSKNKTDVGLSTNLITIRLKAIRQSGPVDSWLSAICRFVAPIRNLADTKALQFHGGNVNVDTGQRTKISADETIKMPKVNKWGDAKIEYLDFKISGRSSRL